jgi:DNA-binding NarL/FixJ family response regulator
MVKRQVNVRMSDMTRDKLDFLSEYYGTQAEAVAVAVDRLYQETRYGYGSDLDLRAAAHGKLEDEDATYLDLSKESIRVLIVDDEPHIRGNIGKLCWELGVDVVGTAASGEEGIELAESLQPHIVLLDRSMPGMDGLAACQAITGQVPYTRVIMTSVQGAESLRRSMLAGARDCLSRPFTAGDLSQSLRRVYAMSPYPRSHTPPAAQEGAFSGEELDGLRAAVRAIEYVQELLARHPELIEGEKE